MSLDFGRPRRGQGLPLSVRLQNYEPVPESGCWIWLGTTSWSGYGSLMFKGRHIRAHRASWELVNGPMPEDLQACHTCDIPSCINPAHIWPGTRSDNMKDAVRKGRCQIPPNPRWNAFKTHCKRGHEFTSENTGSANNHGAPARVCRVCAQMRQAAYRARKSVTITFTPNGR